MDELEKKLQRLRDLQQMLSSSESEIGDWKIVKYYEYNLVLKEPPFDINELHEKRQNVRDEINEIQKDLGIE